MVPHSKIVEFYRRAKESGHPDPDRGVLGRAFATQLDNKYNKDGRVGLFGISESKAKAIGWDELDNAEQNFRAMMDLDAQSYARHVDPIRMLQDTAGSDKESVLTVLDRSLEDVQSKLIIENGELIEIKAPADPETNLLEETANQQLLDEETSRVTSELSKTGELESIASSNLGNERQMDRLVSLLEEYVDKSIG